MEQTTGLEAARLLDATEFAEVLGISLKKFWTMRNNGQLPSPVRIGTRGVKWREGDIVAFVNGLQTVEKLNVS